RSFERGDDRKGAQMVSFAELQRSRALSSAEIGVARRAGGEARRASTEPRSFERGDLAGSRKHRHRVRASTEPRSFERGDSKPSGSLPPKTKSFNGAALFRARRSVDGAVFA